MQLRSDVSIVELEQGSVLLDERSGRYWQINPTAALILSHIVDGGNAETATDAIVENYSVDAETARADIDKVLSDFTDAGLVVP